MRLYTVTRVKKKQVIAIGKKTGCGVELHPVEIIYNTPSILLFCRYANALRTLPDPLARQHLKRSRRGAVLFVQHHLLDSVVGRPLGRLGVVQLVFAHRLPTLSSSLEQCGRNTECTDYNTSITPGASAPPANRQDATVVSKIARSFPQHTRFSLAITCPCCYCCFQPPSFNPCRISCYFFRENMKLHISREQIKKGPYLHFWAPPVQWWGQSRKLDNFLIT